MISSLASADSSLQSIPLYSTDVSGIFGGSSGPVGGADVFVLGAVPLANIPANTTLSQNYDSTQFWKVSFSTSVTNGSIRVYYMKLSDFN